MATIVLVVPDDDAPDLPTLVYLRGGCHSFPEQPDAYAFVARQQLRNPSIDVEVRIR